MVDIIWDWFNGLKKWATSESIIWNEKKSTKANVVNLVERGVKIWDVFRLHRTKMIVETIHEEVNAFWETFQKVSLVDIKAKVKMDTALADNYFYWNDPSVQDYYNEEVDYLDKNHSSDCSTVLINKKTKKIFYVDHSSISNIFWKTYSFKDKEYIVAFFDISSWTIWKQFTDFFLLEKTTWKPLRKQNWQCVRGDLINDEYIISRALKETDPELYTALEGNNN